MQAAPPVSPESNLVQRPPWWRRLLMSPSVWIVIAILALGVLLVDWVDQMGGAAAFRERYGAIAPLLTVTVHILLALTPFPSDAVAIANGVVYGFPLGLALSWLGWWLAALAEFGLGRRVREDFSLEQAVSQAPGWIQTFPVSHPAYLILARQVPWLGGHIASLVPGAAGVAWKRFVWCSALAVIPGSVLMTGIGVGILQAW